MRAGTLVAWGFFLEIIMADEITVSFDEYGQTTLVQNGLVFTMTIKQRLEFCTMVQGSIPPQYMIDKETTILPNGWVIEEDI